MPYRSVLYQGEAVPVPFPATVAETITVDKWYSPFTQHQRRRGLLTAHLDHTIDLPFNEETATPQQSSLATIESPAYGKTIVYQSIAYTVVVTPSETITVDKWYPALSEHQRRRVFFAAHQDHSVDLPFNEDTASQSQKWFRPLSEPVRLRRVAEREPFEPIRVPTEIVTLDKYYTPWIDRIRINQPGIYRQRFHFDIAFNEDTATLSQKWYRALSEPPRLKKLVPGETLWSTFTPAAGEAIFADKWWQPLSEPIRRPALGTYRHDYNFEVAFNEDTTTLVGKWFRSLSEPARVRPAVLAGAQMARVYGYDEATLLSKYWQPLVEPVRRKLFLSAHQQENIDVPFNERTDLFSKWAEPLSEPVRKPSVARFDRNQFWSTFTPAPTEVVTLDKYWRPLSEPTRLPKQLRAAAQQYLALVKVAPFEETTQLDKWYAELSRPARPRQLPVAPYPSVSYGYFVQPGELVTPDKWFSELSRPARPSRLPVAPYPHLFFGLREDTRLLPTWFRQLNEPDRRKRFATAHQQSVQWLPFIEVSAQLSKWMQAFSEPVHPKRLVPSAYYLDHWMIVPSSDVVTLDKYWRPLSEPARTRWFATALQQFRIGVDRQIEFVVPPARPVGTGCIRVAATQCRVTFSQGGCRPRDPEKRRPRK